MLRNSLPTRSILITKNVACPRNFTCCGDYGENSWHLFINSSIAIEIWINLEMWEYRAIHLD